MNASDIVLLPTWTDWQGAERHVAARTLDRIESALAASSTRGGAPLQVVRVGDPVGAGEANGSAVWVAESDGTRAPAARPGDTVMRAPAAPGYYTLCGAGPEARYAVCPRAARPLPRQGWGIFAPVYALGQGRSGDLGDLRRLAATVASRGGVAVAINPLHAVRGEPDDPYSPYSPSSRLWLNPDYIAQPGPADSPGTLIDWRQERVQRHARLARDYEDFGASAEVGDFVGAGGRPLFRQALFDALRAAGRDPFGASDGDLARAGGSRQVAIQQYAQWRAARDLAAVRGEGTALVGDLAVGVVPDGADVWSAPEAFLTGLEVGCPPDQINTRGQKWGLTTFNPQALVAGGYEPFIATIRASMRHYDAIRIDHVMALDRIWVVPEGMDVGDGAYLRFPREDMLALICLESWLQDCAVIGEDLGTVPDGLRSRLEANGIYGLDVLRFRDPQTLAPGDPHWSRLAVTMAATHDLATISGWQTASDLTWLTRIGWIDDPDEAAETRASEVAHTRAHFGLKAQDPHDRLTTAVHATMIELAPHLALMQLDDLVGSTAQTNLPGTIDEHPNWRRMLLGWQQRLTEVIPPAGHGAEKG